MMELREGKLRYGLTLDLLSKGTDHEALSESNLHAASAQVLLVHAGESNVVNPVILD
jgi:hypothetical protein